MVIVSVADLAEAASSVCNTLESRLASLQKSSGANKAAAFAGAANQQRSEIAAAEARARQSGCTGGFLIFQPKPKPQCASILKGIERMKANLRKLQSNQQSLSYASANVNSRRADLLRQLGDNNCGAQYASYSTQNRPRNFLEKLFNPDPVVRQPVIVNQGPGQVLQRDDSFDSGGYDTGFSGGNYRTLCVRTCDGYYFPIAYSTSRRNFEAQEQVCKQMCPGTEVVLYAHRNPGQDSSKALSTVDRSRYTDLPNAFAYRTNLVAGCTCGKSTALDIVAGGYSPAMMNLPSAGIAPIPGARPSRGEDPETVANRLGQLDPIEVGKPNVTVPVASLNVTVTAGGPVRRVGPSYFYAQ